MRILVDITHPAHTYFFRNPLKKIQDGGHDILVTSRKKEMATSLLNEMGIKHQIISSQEKGGIFSLGKELLQRNLKLARVARQFRPDIMTAVGGTSVAQVGAILRIPTVVFYDTENAHLQNIITYPFASCVIVPRCYTAWLPRKRHYRYAGYHEASYLSPDYFKPDLNIAIKNGLAPQGDTFFIRLVSWRSSHDVGEHGWQSSLLNKLIRKLSPMGKVLISSETPLDSEFTPYLYQGKMSLVHHVMAYSRLFVGESATMASECAMLAVPAIYAAHTGRGYTDEQEAQYGLVFNVRDFQWSELEPKIDQVLNTPPQHWKTQREEMLNDITDVASMAVRCIETYPALLTEKSEL